MCEAETDSGSSVKEAGLTDLVGHHVEQRAGFAEVVDGLLQVSEGLPLLQRFGKLPDPSGSGKETQQDNRCWFSKCTSVCRLHGFTTGILTAGIRTDFIKGSKKTKTDLMEKNLMKTFFAISLDFCEF